MTKVKVKATSTAKYSFDKSFHLIENAYFCKSKKYNQNEKNSYFIFFNVVHLHIKLHYF